MVRLSSGRAGNLRVEWAALMERFALFHLLRFPPVLRRLWLPLVGLGLYTALTLYIEQHLLRHDIEFPTGVHALIGVVLGFLLVFRTNTSYERWWEARKLWGQLMNDSRTLALRVHQLAPPGEGPVIGVYLAAFAAALRDHLRGEASVDKLPIPAPATPVTHVPLYVANLIYTRIQSWKLETTAWLFLDRSLAALMDVLGGCERIRNTPVTRSHETFIRSCILFYLLVLPIGLDYGPWIFPAVLIVGYFLLGIEQVAEDIQEPFGKEPDDLPLDRICQTLADSMKAVLPKEAENAEVR